MGEDYRKFHPISFDPNLTLPTSLINSHGIGQELCSTQHTSKDPEFAGCAFRIKWTRAFCRSSWGRSVSSHPKQNFVISCSHSTLFRVARKNSALLIVMTAPCRFKRSFSCPDVSSKHTNSFFCIFCISFSKTGKHAIATSRIQVSIFSADTEFSANKKSTLWFLRVTSGIEHIGH